MNPQAYLQAQQQQQLNNIRLQQQQQLQQLPFCDEDDVSGTFVMPCAPGIKKAGIR